MKVSLIYPPTCDPTSPYLSVPMLTAYLRIISAAYSPLMMDFSVYRTPFSLLTPEQIEADSQPGKNPFHDYFSGELADLLSLHSPDVIGWNLPAVGQRHAA